MEGQEAFGGPQCGEWYSFSGPRRKKEGRRRGQVRRHSSILGEGPSQLHFSGEGKVTEGRPLPRHRQAEEGICGRKAEKAEQRLIPLPILQSPPFPVTPQSGRAGWLHCGGKK